MTAELNRELRPVRIFDRVTQITPDALAAAGAQALALDIDNTLAYDASFTFFPGVREWAAKMLAAGVPMMILSNTYPLRARVLAGKLGVPYIAAADKPNARGFRKCAGALGVPSQALAMAGDQLFTDIRGANAAGCIPFLVRPQHKEILRFLHYRRLREKEQEILGGMKNEAIE